MGDMNGEVIGAIQAALEASIFQSPRNPGLTLDEIQEVLKRLDFKEGEIKDTIADLWRLGRIEQISDGKYRLDPNLMLLPMMWGISVENYPAKPEALDFPIVYLRGLQREVGRGNAKISRSDLVAAGSAQGNDPLDMEIAVTLLEYSRILQINSEIVELAPGTENRPLYSQILKNTGSPRRHPTFERVLPFVSDTIRRREDGRLPSAEPLVSFDSVLEKIGHKNFGVWWHSLWGELNTINPLSHPKSYLLLSAGVCEAMLALVVALAREKGLSMAKKLDDDPKNWKLINLIEAASSGPRPIVADPLRAGLLSLNLSRQHIHAGAVLSQYRERGVVPDVKQEDARFAKEYTDRLGRRILEWLQENGLLP
jgi:hypothetical protein